MAVTGNTELLATKQDLIASLVQKELREQTKFMPLIEDYSALAVAGAKSVALPKFDSFTVGERTSASAGTPANLTADNDVIALDKNLYVQWVIDSWDELQSNVDAQRVYLTRATSGHARKVDELIKDEVEAAASLNLGGAGDVTRDDILDMREHLMGNNADMDNSVLVVGVAQDKAMLKIDEFTRGDAYGASNIPSGFIGRVFGVPVVVSNILASDQAMMFDKAACGIAFQQRPNLASESDIDYGTKARKFALDQILGVQALQLGVNGAGATESPLIAKYK